MAKKVEDNKTKKDVVHYWRVGEELMLPKDMTSKHLKNAIVYAGRNNMYDPIMAHMILELESRSQKGARPNKYATKAKSDKHSVEKD
jgi:hypothetical protein